jgi:hypothetical protein
MQATGIKRMGGNAASADTESSSNALSHLCYEREDQVKPDAKIFNQMYSLTGAGS